MKKLLLLLLTILVIMPLAATGQSDDGASEKEEMSIIWWGSQNRHDRTIKTIELYMEKNPNVEITYEFAGWGDYWTKVTTMAAGGMLPDVMQQDYAKLSDWTDKGLLSSLDSYVDSGIIDFSDVEDSALSGGKINGELYAVNIGLNSMCIILDKDQFAKAGVPLPDQNWTWDEFEAITLELHEKLGIYGMGNDLLNEQMWKSLYLGNGEWAYAEDGKGLGYTDDSLFVDYSQMVMDLMAAGAIPSREIELALYHDKGPEAMAMVKGESAMEMMWSNQLTALSSAAGADRNFYMTHLPRLNKNGASANYLKPGQFLSMSSKTKNGDRAADFINFFTNDLDANKILLAERGVPVSAAIREGLKPLLEPASVVAFDFIGRVATDSSPLPNPDPVGSSDIIQNVYIPEFWDPMTYGLVSVEEAVAALRNGAEKVLSNN